VKTKCVLKRGKKLKKDLLMSFEEFCKDMYVKNCKEREMFKDAILSYEDYIANNNNFLLDIFEEVCNNQNTD